MESLSRVVSESLARHGFDRPVDYRRLRWSRWFRCESPHSLLSVPSKPGVFAIAEEVLKMSGAANHKGPAALGCVGEQGPVGVAQAPKKEARKPEAAGSMLAVTKFFEDEDMAFSLDRMLSRQNPIRSSLESGRYFIRYVVIEDQTQRRSVCNALNQWIASSSELATGIGVHFASSSELPATDPNLARTYPERQSKEPLPGSQPGSGDATDIRCPSLFPSGF